MRVFPVSCFLFPVSCFLFPVSCFPVSCFLLPCFLLPASCFLLSPFSAPQLDIAGGSTNLQHRATSVDGALAIDFARAPLAALGGNLYLGEIRDHFMPHGSVDGGAHGDRQVWRQV